MNKELRELVLEAGAPLEMLDQLWFNVFVVKFASMLLAMAEEAVAMAEETGQGE